MTKNICIIFTAALGLSMLAGCSSAPRKPFGAVVPIEGGQYRSSLKSSNEAQAQKVFMTDAEITCEKPPASSMFWSKATPGKYVVVSQTMKEKEGKEIKSDDKKLDAGIAIALRKFGMEAQDAVEVNTIFKCL